MTLARKLELVAQIVGGMDGDGDGCITQEEVMRYYKVGRNGTFNRWNGLMANRVLGREGSLSSRKNTPRNVHCNHVIFHAQ